LVTLEEMIEVALGQDIAGDGDLFLLYEKDRAPQSALYIFANWDLVN
jgi:hypothetical protein